MPGARPHGLILITRVGIAAGLLAIGIFLYGLLADQAESDRLARDDRRCLVDVLIAVQAALHGQEAPADLPPACQRIVDRGGAPAP